MEKLDAHIVKDTLYLSVENLSELRELLDEIQLKQSELKCAVERLRMFNLKLIFRD